MPKSPPIAKVLSVARAVLCYFLTAIASALSHFFVYEQIFSSMLEDGVVSQTILLIYAAVVYLIAFFLFTATFAEYHKPFRKNFPLCRRSTEVSAKEKIILLFKEPSFLITFAATTICILLFPYSTVAEYPTQLIFGISYRYGDIMLVTLVALPVLLSLFVLAYLLAAKNVRNEGIREKQKHNDTPIRSLVWQLLNRLLAIVSVSLLIPLLIVVASQFLIFLVFFPLVIAAILVFVVLRYARAIRIRRKFLHSLKETCQKSGYTLSKIQKPYRSLFFITEGISFSVQDPSGKQHDCKLLHSIKRTAPMFFHSDGFATSISPVSFFKAELFYRVKTMPYSFDSEHQKCVIVCPIPRAFYARNESSESEVDSAVTESKMIFAGIGGAMGRVGGLHQMSLPKNARSRELDIGDTFNGYKFYNATGFLNAIEYNVFDR